RPLAVSSVSTPPGPADRRVPLPQPGACVQIDAADDGCDWELDWPGMLYAPVAMPGQRPLGLVLVGSRTPHWYTQHEIDYVAALGTTLSGLMLSLSGPLTRLTGREAGVARLVGQGLSLAEVATALEIGLEEARAHVGRVLRKLSLR